MARSAEDDLPFVSVFPYGCLVRVTGLLRCKRFNGLMGMVVQPPLDDTTKHQVQLIGERKAVLVQRKNLFCATESADWTAKFLEIWPFDLNRIKTRSEVPVSAVFGGEPSISSYGPTTGLFMQEFFCKPEVESCRPKWIVAETVRRLPIPSDPKIPWVLAYDSTDTESLLNQFANIFSADADGKDIIRGNLVIAKLDMNSKTPMRFETLTVRDVQQLVWRYIEFLKYGTVVSLVSPSPLEGKQGLVVKDQFMADTKCLVKLHGAIDPICIPRSNLQFDVDRAHSYDNLALEVWSVDANKIKTDFEIPVSPVVGTSSVFWDERQSVNSVAKFLKNPRNSTRASWKHLVQVPIVDQEDGPFVKFVYFNDEDVYADGETVHEYFRKFFKGKKGSLIVLKVQAPVFDEKGKVETQGFPTPELLPVCARDVQPLLWKLRSGDRGDWIANGIVVPSAPSYRTE